MGKSSCRVFDQLVKEAKEDPNIIGFFLSGSRGKNRHTMQSDYDIEVVTKDSVQKIYKEKYKQKNIEGFEFCVFSISEFRRHAEIGTDYDWDRASYTHLKPVVDKTGEIQKLISEKGKIPKDRIKKSVSRSLDAYINYVYRSLKCFRDGNIVGARLEAARTVNCLLDTVFALDCRVTPYYKYLEWELDEWPLKKFKISSKDLIKDILLILESGDAKSQQKLFVLVEKVLRKEGYEPVFDAWRKEQTGFIKTFKV